MNEKKKNVFSTIVVSLMAAVFIAVGVLILFVPQVEVQDICYFICGFIVVLGIYMIVRYFMTGGYERLNEYGFSEGVLFVLLGICGLVSAKNIAASFLTALGLLLLLSGVIKLQYALDLKCMEDKNWIGFFAVTIVLLGCSVVVILKPFEDQDFYQNFTCYVLMVDGVVEIINILYLNFRTKAYRRRMEKGQAEPEMANEERKMLCEETKTVPNKEESANLTKENARDPEENLPAEEAAEEKE